MELSVETILPQVSYSSSDVRIVSLPSHGNLYEKNGYVMLFEKLVSL